MRNMTNHLSELSLPIQIYCITGEYNFKEGCHENKWFCGWLTGSSSKYPVMSVPVMEKEKGCTYMRKDEKRFPHKSAGPNNLKL